MKNKKLFSGGLYLEGIRQTRVIGILSIILITFAAVIGPIGNAIIQMAEEARYIGNEPYVIERETVTGLSMNPALMFVFIVIAPAMVFTLFGFMNKRNTSDFYHSIPHTRLCILVSFALSIISWIAVAIISTCAVSSLVYAILGKYYVAVYSTLLKYAVGCFVISLLVISATVLAMSITGTLMTNLILTCLILFVPRICYYAFDSACASSVQILVAGHVLPLSGTGYNMLTDLFMSSFTMSNGDYLSLFFSASGLIYTTLLAAIYAVLAALFFGRRKSETAGNSAPSRRLQALYRCAVTMVVCFIAVFVIVSETNSLDEGDIVGIAFLYIIAILVYFIYELITTRKLKNLARAIPGLLVVVVLNVALISAGAITKNAALSYSPDADDIDGVQIVNNFSYYRSLDYLEYKQLIYGDYTITDPEAKKIISKSLADNISCIKSNKRLWTDFNITETVKINTGSGTKYRTLWLTEDDADKLSRMLFDNDDYRNDFTKLPDDYSSLWISSDFADRIMREDNGGDEIYECLKKEMAKISYDELYDHLRDSGQYSDIRIEVTTLYKSSTVSFEVPVCGDLFPETFNLYLEKVTAEVNNDTDEMNQRLGELYDSIKGMDDDDIYKNTYGYMNFYLYSEYTGSYANYYVFIDQSTNKSDMKQFVDDLRELAVDATDDTVTYGDNFASIQMYIADPDEGEEYEIDGEDYYYISTATNYSFIINLRDVDADRITKIIDKINGSDISIDGGSGVLE